MKKPSFSLLVLAALQLCSPRAFSIEPAQWQFRQAFDVAQGGPTRVSLPADTLGGAQPDLRDLRILGPDGAELPCAFLELPAERAAGEIIKTLRRPVSLQVNTEKKEVIITIKTDIDANADAGPDARLHSVELLIPDTKDYLLPARVEISDDARNWETLSSGQALFRRGQGQGGRHGAVAQTAFSLNRRVAAWVRVTISFDSDPAAPVAVSGALIRTVTGTPGRAAIADEDVPARITATEQRAGETLLVIDLGAANLSLSKLAFRVQDPLFMRGVEISAGGDTGDAGKTGGAGKNSGENAGKHNRDKTAPLRAGTIYRVEAEGRIDAHKTELDLGGVQVPARRIIASIQNGDSPPLDVRGVEVKRRPVHIAFNPPAAGRYEFLSGNKAAAAPRYDLAALSGRLAGLPLTQIDAGALVETPGYIAPKPPGEAAAFATRALFWVALAAVVIVLLVVVGRLLPKADKS